METSKWNEVTDPEIDIKEHASNIPENIKKTLIWLFPETIVDIQGTELISFIDWIGEIRFSLWDNIHNIMVRKQSTDPSNTFVILDIIDWQGKCTITFTEKQIGNWKMRFDIYRERNGTQEPIGFNGEYKESFKLKRRIVRYEKEYLIASERLKNSESIWSLMMDVIEKAITHPIFDKGTIKSRTLLEKWKISWKIWKCYNEIIDNNNLSPTEKQQLISQIKQIVWSKWTLESMSIRARMFFDLNDKSTWKESKKFREQFSPSTNKYLDQIDKYKELLHSVDNERVMDSSYVTEFGDLIGEKTKLYQTGKQVYQERLNQISTSLLKLKTQVIADIGISPLEMKYYLISEIDNIYNIQLTTWSDALRKRFKEEHTTKPIRG